MGRGHAACGRAPVNATGHGPHLAALTVSIDANLRGVHGGGARQINGILGFAWVVDPSWSLLGHFSSVRGKTRKHLPWFQL